MTTDFRTGYIALIGKPNVGKSTLINALLGQKIAAVSSRPQTTRRRQLGILTTPNAQLIFVDTPGMHSPRHKLGEFLNQEAVEALEEVDIVVFLLDASTGPDEEDELIATRLAALRRRPAVILGMNKIDLVPAGEAQARQEAYQPLVEGASVVSLSALYSTGRVELINAIIDLLPQREPDFPEDQVTDLYEREIAAELIREAALYFLREEVPHGVNIRIDQFMERGDEGAYIHATIFVERESHKGIVIGERGGMMKKIGSMARQEIEAMSGRKVYLELRAKVAKGWRNDDAFLQRFGYGIKEAKTKRKK